MSDSDDDWQPPTEAEKKVLAARRERSDKISKLMGDYLLKGYRMLATTCNQCGTIELQDKQGRIYCVACTEVDCDENSKDNPVLSSTAASHQIAEEGERQSVSITSQANSQPVDHQLGSRHNQPDVTTSTLPVSTRTPTSGSVRFQNETFQVDATTLDPSHYESLQDSLSVVLAKMKDATRTLSATENVDASRNLVCLIKECADCVLSIRRASEK